jgi:hypothetical protein
MVHHVPATYAIPVLQVVSNSDLQLDYFILTVAGLESLRTKLQVPGLGRVQSCSSPFSDQALPLQVASGHLEEQQQNEEWTGVCNLLHPLPMPTAHVQARLRLQLCRQRRQTHGYFELFSHKRPGLACVQEMHTHFAFYTFPERVKIGMTRLQGGWRCQVRVSVTRGNVHILLAISALK